MKKCCVYQIYQRSLQYQIERNKMKTAYHKQFGQIEITSIDATTTTITIASTGEVKKLLNKFANLLIQDEPFTKAAKKPSTKEVLASRELTQEEKDIVAESVKKEIAKSKSFNASNMSAEQWANGAKYRQSK